MNTKTIQLIHLANRHEAGIHYKFISGSALCGYGQIAMENGFYFLIVTNGTASISAGDSSSTVSANSLIVLTPGLDTFLTDMTSEFAMSCLYIEPEYFDTIDAGQIIYNQISQLSTGSQQPGIFLLDTEQTGYLLQTMGLFSERLDNMCMYRDGAVRHLCSFLMLQISNIVYLSNSNPSSYIKRSTEIFRNFRRLAIHSYRKHHTIKFYADKLNITTTYLSRIVKQTTGHTVYFHISELLCADARKMLEYSDKDIKEIADLLGFADQSVFCKFFTRKTGMPPLKFRMKRDTGK